MRIVLEQTGKYQLGDRLVGRTGGVERIGVREVAQDTLDVDASGNRLQALELLVQRQQLADLLKYSLIVVASVPVLLIYPFVARYFTKGILIGAVKG